MSKELRDKLREILERERHKGYYVDGHGLDNVAALDMIDQAYKDAGYEIVPENTIPTFKSYLKQVMADEKSDPSLGSTSGSTPESVKQEADDLAKDLLEILKKYASNAQGIMYVINIKDLLVDLSIYITNRDYRILQHGIRVGEHKAYGEIQSFATEHGFDPDMVAGFLKGAKGVIDTQIKKS
jgi:hypothetical protein